MSEKHRCFINRGLFSTYFLGILFVISISVTAISFNLKAKFHIIDNMKENLKYQSEEMKILAEMKCLLANDALEEFHGENYAITSIEEDCLYVEVYGEREETIVIFYDKESKEVIDVAIRRSIKMS